MVDLPAHLGITNLITGPGSGVKLTSTAGKDTQILGAESVVITG